MYFFMLIAWEVLVSHFENSVDSLSVTVKWYFCSRFKEDKKVNNFRSLTASSGEKFFFTYNIFLGRFLWTTHGKFDGTDQIQKWNVKEIIWCKFWQRKHLPEHPTELIYQSCKSGGVLERKSWSLLLTTSPKQLHVFVRLRRNSQTSHAHDWCFLERW